MYNGSRIVHNRFLDVPPPLPSFDVVNKTGQGHGVQGREKEALGKDRARG